MPIGDSITQGELNAISQNQLLLKTIDRSRISYRADGAPGILMEGNGGYRLYLEQMLIDMSWDIEMVGQRTEGGGHHEGYPGYMTSDLLAILDDILLANPPNVILLHIGTNDLPTPIDPDSCYQNILEMLDIIHAFNPEIEVILAQIIPCLQNTPLGEDRYPAIIELNNLLTQIPGEKEYVTLVDMWTAFIETDNWENELMSGTYHPNDQGYYLMAENWRDKLDLIITGRSPVVTNIFPNQGYNDQYDLQCTIEGDYFLDGVDVYLHNNQTSENLYAFQVIFESVSRIYADFDLAQGAIGEWEVMIVNPNHMRSIDSPGIIFTILDASGRADISGTVTYGKTGRPVSLAILNLTHQEGASIDTTQNDGTYRFEYILSDMTQLLPEKENDQQDAITGSDVILTLQYLAFISDLNDEQLFAADVTEDGAVTGSDAQAMLRYLAFYSDNIGSTGQWRFDPADTSFMLNADSNVDFEGFLLGDVNLNWGQVLEKNQFEAMRKTSPPLSNVNLRLAEFYRYGTQQIVVPVLLTNVDAPVQSAVFTIAYDSNCLHYLATGKSTLNDKFMLVANGEIPGKIHIAMAGIEGIETDGEILMLHFRLKSPEIDHRNLEMKITESRVNDLKVNSSSQVENRIEETNPAVLPNKFSLLQNYPNPFNPCTTIRYQLEQASHVSLVIYDLAGHLVKTLVNSHQNVGWYAVQWDGSNKKGTPVNSGIYFCKLSTHRFTKTIKMELIK